MAGWTRVETEAPELARRVRELFEAGRDKTIASLRADGSPRISGIEMEFLDGDVQFGMLRDSLKLRDVRRDPRVAIHSPTLVRRGAESEWRGDAKLAGNAVEFVGREDPEHPGAGQFRLDVREVVLTRVDEDAEVLVIESWHEGRGLQRRERA
ncbi:hypothetical protein CLV46_3100 [Diaminobutyricimonas aerilata]|uniref:Pyridoxamine 5'-phosphate oxidase n=1 Tax=Diaminobutyricimonas aerilata TaxID=1162967 RepID=A0A2M9CNR3_9MICO|nr:pyridoxamine 5-phosphate oxidase [Diaminobutyricimonas aerilata]PJJ73508.1 hypothetical protein CLV46_3100 [Diaminobutyricimonas aerilata]